MIHQEYYGLGTAINLSVDDQAGIDALTAGHHVIQHYEDLLTVNRAESEVMDINHAAGVHAVSVSPTTYTIVKTAVEVSRWHLGFNAAIGPLVKLWHIGFQDAHRPLGKDIQERLQLIDPDHIQLDDAAHSVFLPITGMELDLGGIAKGYIADAVAHSWHELGVQRGIIDLGGNILLVGPGTHEHESWHVGIQDPHAQRNVSLGILTTSAKSIVTSGIYERRLVLNGHEYHHMFDSHTGMPIANNLASVTIISDRSLDGDIWTTLAFYAGATNGLALIERQPGLEAIFVTRADVVTTTSGLKNSFTQTK